MYAIFNDGGWSYASTDNPISKEAAGCYENYRNTEKPVHIRLIYNHNTLELWLDTHGHGKNYRQCFAIDRVNLPSDYYFGVSSSTGDLPDDHDLLSVDLYEIDPPKKDVSVSIPIDVSI